MIVATVAAAATYAQGQAIRKIETREHEWQAVDRKSAHIEVNRMHETRPGSLAGFSQQHWIRLRNAGRAEAWNVTWTDIPTERGDAFSADRRQVDVLYPGEHYDLSLNSGGTLTDDAEFTVSWTDGNGTHETTRIINL